VFAGAEQLGVDAPIPVDPANSAPDSDRTLAALSAYAGATGGGGGFVHPTGRSLRGSLHDFRGNPRKASHRSRGANYVADSCQLLS
jgi:hypothetical protein